ncbi:MAG: outer membrane beta-barrel protein [Bacteroidota bacterium]
MKQQEPHNLDQFLKQKLEGRTYEFQETYWQQAEELLDLHTDPPKRGFWWRWEIGLGLLAALVLSVGLGAWYFSHANDASELLAGAFTSSEVVPSSVVGTSVATSFSAGIAQTDCFSENQEQTRVAGSSSQNIDIAVNSPKPSAASGPTVATAHDQPHETGNAIFHAATHSPKGKMGAESSKPHQQGWLGRLLGNKKNSAEKSLATIAVQPFTLGYQPASITGRVIPLESIRELGPRHFLSLEGGVNLSPGLNSNSTSAGISIAPYAGIGYRFALTPKWQLHTGLRYQMRTALNRERMFASTQLGFGREEEEITLEARQLHRIEMPLEAGFQLHNRHFVRGGLAASYLLGVNSQQSTLFTDATGNQTAQDQGSWGYRDGFVPFQFSLSMGYRYYLGKGWNLDANVMYGLTDLTETGVFTQDQNDRDMMLRLGVTWDVWRR